MKSRAARKAKDTKGRAGTPVLPKEPALAADDVSYTQRLSRLGFALAVVWLLFLIFPIAGLYEMRSEPARLLLAAVGTALGTAIYAWAAWRAVRAVSGAGSPLGTKARWVSPGLLTLLGLALPIFYGENWVGLLGFAGILVGLTLPFGLVVTAAVAFTLLTTATALIAGLDWGPAVSITIYSGLGGLVAFGLRWLAKTNWELRAARQEVARLAVTEERLRFARDLHDLLGRSLSLITLKSELAGRLADANPERTLQEIGDIEHAAREALCEVRRAVDDYRSLELDAELNGATEILDAAGIECRIVKEVASLPSHVEPVLAFVVREGVTNVIRHSHCARCDIRLIQDENSIHAEIMDDGNGVKTFFGSGLSGLNERVAEVGGSLHVGPLSEGGYRLHVEVPVCEEAYRSGEGR